MKSLQCLVIQVLLSYWVTNRFHLLMYPFTDLLSNSILMCKELIHYPVFVISFRSSEIPSRSLFVYVYSSWVQNPSISPSDNCDFFYFNDSWPCIAVWTAIKLIKFLVCLLSHSSPIITHPQLPCLPSTSLVITQASHINFVSSSKWFDRNLQIRQMTFNGTARKFMKL